ncbi:MAG: class II fructose-bisphosphate aldolase [Planctomycetota bacterium]
MPLITQSQQVKEIYQEAAEAGTCIGTFCTDDQRTTESILKGTYEKSTELGKPNLPVVLGFSVNYPPRGGMNLYTTVKNPKLGLRAIFDDVDMLLSEESPYRNLRVMLHLDHAFPWLDADALYNYADKFATVMYDASEKPFEENMRMTAEYVEQLGDKVLVEGCVDEIAEAGTDAKNEITTVEQAEKFVSRTGVDLIVANLGTEHRATTADKHYHGHRAREISKVLGKILVLHGTSCLKNEDLYSLASDGIIKVNVFTLLAVVGGQAVGDFVLENIGNMYDRRQIKKMVKIGILGRRFLEAEYIEDKCQGQLNPKLNIVAETLRRDAYVARVKEQIKRYLDAFGYAKL